MHVNGHSGGKLSKVQLPPSHPNICGRRSGKSNELPKLLIRLQIIAALKHRARE
jgi:hypothetical protein